MGKLLELFKNLSPEDARRKIIRYLIEHQSKFGHKTSTIANVLGYHPNVLGQILSRLGRRGMVENVGTKNRPKWRLPEKFLVDTAILRGIWQDGEILSRIDELERERLRRRSEDDQHYKLYPHWKRKAGPL